MLLSSTNLIILTVHWLTGVYGNFSPQHLKGIKLSTLAPDVQIPFDVLTFSLLIRCGLAWTSRGLCEPLQANPFLHPHTTSLNNCTSALSACPTISIRRLILAGSMRHIQMDTSPKKEAEAENNSYAAGSSGAPGQDGALHSGQDCRVLVGYPEKEHKLQKVYHVSIITDLPGHKSCTRQALKRTSTDQLFPEPARSPKRAFWGQSRNDGLHGHSELDSRDQPSCSDVADEDEQGSFEDGLLSEDVPLCGSAQHFSHSGLRVIEHRAEDFFPRDSPCRRLTVRTPSSMSRPWTDSLSPPLQTTLHSSIPKPAQMVNLEELARPQEGNGTSDSVDHTECNQAANESDSNQHILDIVLHNIAHSESPREKAAYANGSLGAETVEDGMSKESPALSLPSQKLQDVEGPNSTEMTPPGPSRLRIPGSATSTAVKRKLLPSSETGDSCSEDEGQSKRWRGGQGCQALHGACRSTDAKAAPFWNHLLPASRNSQKSPSDCTSRRLKRGLRLKSRSLRSPRKGPGGSRCTGNWTTSCVSRSLLGNFEESILRGRFAPSGQIEGFTAEIGASGSYCPEHVTLPVEVTYFHISEHSVPSPFLGVIDLEAVGKKGYSVPSTGTIQVTLFNPNKTVVKMFLVTYDFKDMPANHVTFLRHRIFLVPVQDKEEGLDGTVGEQEVVGCGTMETKEKAKRILCYLMHLRFQRSKSGKIYLYDDIRLLFSRKSIEVDTGIPYELKSFTETPRNPKYSPRV
ncbi:atos homolog protein B [Rhinophrynus dorsalis]